MRKKDCVRLRRFLRNLLKMVRILFLFRYLGIMKQKESVNPESSDSAMSSDFDGQLERIEEYTKRRVPVITGLLLKSKSNKMYYRNKSVKIPKTGGDGAGDQIYKAWSEVADEAEIE